jgi:hypothetical protein
LSGTNLFGTAESTAELSLPKSPPKILEELQPRVKVKEGEPMVLQMRFDKLSGAEVKWYACRGSKSIELPYLSGIFTPTYFLTD